MVRITLELIRKRTEHHEGPLEELVEIALHQFKIRKIETLNQVCPRLQILLLQNNKIRKIENLGRMRSLVYLNLAINRITRVENMESLESLQKLDLTLNYINDYRDFATLSGLTRLQELYTLGNPCESYKYFKEFLLVNLQNLNRLNGKEVTRAERIEASRVLKENIDEVRAMPMPPEHPDWEAESQGSDYEENDANTKIKRAAKESAQNYADLRMVKKERIKGQRNDEGLPLQWNDVGWKWELEELGDSQELLFKLFIPANLSSDYCAVDVQVDHLHIKVKEKTLQLRLPRRVHAGQSRVVRVTTTGVLKVYMPVFAEDGLIAVKKPQKRGAANAADQQESAAKQEAIQRMKILEAEYKSSLEREREAADEPDDLPDLV